MMIDMKAPDTGRTWRLVPFDNGLCFALYVSPMKGAKSKKGEPVKADFSFTGKYPHNLAHGVECAINGMLADPNGSASIECDPKHLVRTVKKTLEDFKKEVIESITIKGLEEVANAISEGEE